MTINTGQKVLAADYTAFRNRVDGVLGDGNGVPQAGYGQTLTSPTVSVGDKITVAAWNALRDDINTARLHQTGSAFTSVQLSGGTAINKLTASFANAYDSCISLIEAGASSYSVGSVAVSGLNTVTQGSAWGSGSAQRLTLTQTFTFSTATAARYFFNSGGALSMTLAHPSTSTSQNQYWHDTLTSIGTVTMSASSTTSNSGTTSTGYYSLSTTPVTLLTASGSTGIGAYYNNNTVTIKASSNGNTVTLTIVLLDGHTSAYSDAVASGTNCVFGMRKAVTYLTEETPTYVAGSWIAST